jgi:polar amino acid transport system substrate-binding protein
VYATGLKINSDEQVVEDNISIVFKFKDGSIGTIIYSAMGGSGMEKEYIEAFTDSKSAKLVDFKTLSMFDGYKNRNIKLRSQDKGQSAEIEHFFASIKGTSREYQSFQEIYMGSLATYKILESLRSGKPMPLNS